MKDLTKERITEIVENADDVYAALLNLYKEALSPISWEEIDSINPWGIHINRTTAEYILEIMHKKFTVGEADPWRVNSLILNKGFSSQYDELPAWKIEIASDAFTVKK